MKAEDLEAAKRHVQQERCWREGGWHVALVLKDGETVRGVSGVNYDLARGRALLEVAKRGLGDGGEVVMSLPGVYHREGLGSVA